MQAVADIQAQANRHTQELVAVSRSCSKGAADPGASQQYPAGIMLLLVCLALLLSSAARAQENPGADQPLNLFQALEQVNRPDTTAQQPARPAANANTPRFELVGTSRFGDTRTARLRTADGQVIAVRVVPGQGAAIPGHPGYRITDAGSRRVAVRFPGNVPCNEFPDKGISCESADNTARLQVATAAPIQVQEPQPPQRRRDRRGGANGAESDEADGPQNPFAAALRAARERNPEDEAVLRAQAERFERRRIDPSDVPEGYQVVRTPFGDRLIEIQQQ